MTQPIASQQARAIKTADALCFDHNPDGTGAIRAVTRAKSMIGGGETTEYTVTVPVEVSRVQNYGPDSAPDGWRCFAMIGSSRHDDVAMTVARHIKAGSRIALVWTRDNSSPVTKEAGLYVDMLDVKVQNGSVTDTFRVATYIGYNNTARMTRRV